MKRKVFNIFLASPGDLKDERKAINDIVNRINKILGRTNNWYIELLGWEDTLPGANRPQELINKDIEICDLFLGMLWKRWGSPTGKSDSGFKEEFDYANNLNKKNKKPEIWIYLKNVDEELLDDPGEQLNKVLGFRKWLINSKKFFCKEFKETEDGEKLIYDNIIKYLLILDQQSSQNRSKQNLQIEKQEKTGEKISESHKDLFLDINQVVQDNKTDAIEFWERARLMLIARAWFDQVYETSFLGNHDINLLFTNRKNWRLTDEEKLYILKSMLKKPDFRPAWFCYEGSNTKFTLNLLKNILNTCEDYSVKYNSFDILNNMNFTFNEKILMGLISDPENKYRTDIINKLDSTKYYQFILNLKKKVSKITSIGSDFYKNILQVNSKMNFTLNPNEEYKNLLALPKEDVEKYIDLLKGSIKNIESDILKSSLKIIDNRFKKLVLEELDQRSELTLEILHESSQSDAISIKKYAISKLLDIGEDVDISIIEKISKKTIIGTINYLLIKYYRNKNYEEIKDKYFWFNNTHGEIIYEVLATKFFHKFKKRLRNDLEDNFEALDLESKKQFELEHGTQLTEILINKYKQETLNYMKSLYLKAGLRGIFENGSRADIKFARKYIFQTEYGIADEICFKIFAKYGTREDADFLLAKTREAENVFKKSDLIKSVLSISPGTKGIITKLLKSKDQEILSLALDYYDNIKSKSKIKYLKKLLLNDNDSIRIKALALLVDLLTINQLKRLIIEYSNKKSYYYDVVAWLDKLAYTPKDIRKMYFAQLRSSLKAS